MDGMNLTLMIPELYLVFFLNVTVAAEIYTPKCLSEAVRLKATTAASGLLINDGKGRFSFQPLPRLAQAAPRRGILTWAGGFLT